MKNQYLGYGADELYIELGRQEAIKKHLEAALKAAGVPLLTDDDTNGLEDCISECQGAIANINEAMIEAGLDASQYARAVAHDLRVGA